MRMVPTCLGASVDVNGCLPGCVDVSTADELDSDEGRMLEGSLSSGTSIMTSPRRVSSVFVGETGD
jgi:hypothetical protein